MAELDFARRERRWTRETARKVLAAWERSGESMARFGARHRLERRRL